MKESRLLIFLFIVLMILLFPLYFISIYFGVSKNFSLGISSNLLCGYIVGLITSICQYTIQKQQIINNIYSLYFDLYRTYYITKNRKILNHYFSIQFYKKLIELQPKINEQVDNYYGFCKRKDSTYKKINPNIILNDSYKIKAIGKSLFRWNNKKYFDCSVGTINLEIEKILKNINYKRFLEDKKSMEKIYNYILD